MPSLEALILIGEWNENFLPVQTPNTHPSTISALIIYFGWSGFETGSYYVVLAVLELMLAHTGLELRDLPASASSMLGSEVCATKPGNNSCFLNVVMTGSSAAFLRSRSHNKGKESRRGK